MDHEIFTVTPSMFLETMYRKKGFDKKKAENVFSNQLTLGYKKFISTFNIKMYDEIKGPGYI